ncbi:hypothetical protein O3M35_013249 [Rhynocoris fuscipes]|uniref:Uncharacterized protein n=1 Tax=Rhynocoris fuscipes TaxID=488301 RepID=A0AAW1CEI4_9HEMI
MVYHLLSMLTVLMMIYVIASKLTSDFYTAEVEKAVQYLRTPPTPATSMEVEEIEDPVVSDNLWKITWRVSGKDTFSEFQKPPEILSSTANPGLKRAKSSGDRKTTWVYAEGTRYGRKS